jgi:hypothetical protein
MSQTKHLVGVAAAVVGTGLAALLVAVMPASAHSAHGTASNGMHQSLGMHESLGTTIAPNVVEPLDG